MRKDVLSLGGDNLIAEIGSQLGLNPDQLTLLSQTENFVYEVELPEGSCILRVMHVEHRELAEVQAELDWIDFLNDQGVQAARPLQIKENQIIQQITAGGHQFYATFFEKVRGQTFTDHVDGSFGFEPEHIRLYELWGQALGKLHQLAKKYGVPAGPNRRKDWDQVITSFDGDLTPYAKVVERQRELIEYLRTLPQDTDSYGMVHSDFIYNNFFVHNSEIFPFDFDHSKYHWFIFDFPIILDAARYLPRQGMKEEEFLTNFFGHFMRGYEQEHTLSQFWIDQIPQFAKYWRIDGFITSINKMHVDELEIWETRALTKAQRNIERDIPVFKMISC